jgi:hypothetical protein
MVRTQVDNWDFTNNSFYNYWYLEDVLFDRCTGIFTNSQRVSVPFDIPNSLGDTVRIMGPLTGTCFSPNDSFVYVVSYNAVLQWEIADPNPATAWSLVGMVDTAVQNDLLVMIYPGPDGRLYIGKQFEHQLALSYIKYPNLKGALSDFCQNCLLFDTPSYYHGPNFAGGITILPNMPNYVLGAKNCPPLSVPELALNDGLINVYPNPASELLNVDLKQAGSIALFDGLGREVLQKSALPKGKNVLSLRQLATGVYLYRFTGVDGTIANGKLVIDRLHRDW